MGTRPNFHYKERRREYVLNEADKKTFLRGVEYYSSYAYKAKKQVAFAVLFAACIPFADIYDEEL